MKRKVNLVGQNTLTVSLPSNWVKKYGIKKGDEIELKEDNKNLIIQLEDVKKGPKQIELKLKSSYPQYVIALIRNLYINAYDLITLHFNSEHDILAVTEIVNYLIGYEIIEQSKLKCIIKDIASEKPEEYETIHRKIWLTIKLMGDIIIDSLQNKTSELNHRKINDLNLNTSKFSCYCRRILYKNNLLSDEKGLANYIIINRIHMIRRDLLELHEYLYGNRFKVKKETTDFAKKTMQAFNLLYEFYYQPKKDSTQISLELIDSLIKEACEFIARDCTKNSVVFYRLAEIAKIISTAITKVETVSLFEESSKEDEKFKITTRL